jgi:hypothetical protein
MMKMRRLLAVVGTLGLVTILVLAVAGTALAQSTTPPAQTTPGAPALKFGFGFRGFGFSGGSTASFDAVAKALNLTPTQLFEQLHSGKTLAEIATAQGVDLQKVQEALQAQQTQAMKDAIAQAVKDGKITQAQADWLLQGVEKGYLGKGRGFMFDFGHGKGMRGGMMFKFGGKAPSSAPVAPMQGTTA